MCDIENIDNNKNDDFNLRDIQNDNCSEEHIYNYNGSIKDEIINIHENCHSYVNVLYFKKLKLNKRIFGKLKDKNIVIYLKYKDSKCTSKNIQVTDPEITNLYLCFLITEPFIKDEKNIIKIYIKYLKDDKYKILSFGFLELNLIDFSEKFYKKKSYMLCYDKNNNKYIFGYFILILANQIKWTVYNNNVSYQITKNSYFINNQINYDEQLLYICKKIEQILLKSVFTNKSNSIQNTQNKDLLKHFTVTHSCPATFRITPKEKTTLNGNAPPKEKATTLNDNAPPKEKTTTLNCHSIPTQIVDKKDVDQKDVKQISYQSAGIDNADEKCESTNIKTNDSNFGNHIKQIGQDENVDENVEGSIDENLDENVEGSIDENLDENVEGSIDENLDKNVERRMDENVEGRMDENVEGRMDEHVDENSSLNEATYSKKFILNKNIKKHKSLQNLNNHNPRLKIPSNYLNSKKTNLDDNSICNYHSDGAIKKAFSENFLSRIILDEDQNIEKLNLLKKNTTIKPKPKLNLKPLDNKINNFIIKSKNNISTNKTKFFLEKHHKMYCAQNNKIPIKQNNSPINITQKEETKEDYHISCIHNIFDGDGDGDKDGDGNGDGDKDGDGNGDGDKDGDGNGDGNGDGDEDLSNNINNVSTCLENKITDSITQSLNGSKNTTDVLTEVQKEIDESHMLHDKNESNDICNYNDPDVNNDKRDEIDSIYEDENLFDIFILKKLENILNNNLDNFIEQAEFILHHMKKKILKKNEFFAEQIKNQYSTNTVLIKKDIFDKKNENSECCILSKQDDHTEKNNINYNVKNDILKILENCIHTTLLYIQFVLSDKNVDTTQKDVFITYKEIINNIKNAIDDCKKQKETISLNYTNNINFDSLSKDRKNILLTTTKSENENVIEKINPYSYVNDDSCLTMSSCSDSSQTEEIMIFKPVNYINKNISTSIQYYQKKWKHKLSKVGMYV